MAREETSEAPDVLWLPTEWMTWRRDGLSGAKLETTVVDRAHEIWEHADSRFHSGAKELDIVDGVIALKRAISQRMGALDDVYHFRELPLVNRPKRVLDVMHAVGLVRPVMLRRLIEIRNLLEHNDDKPPPMADCQALSELVWYFLKSTDGLLSTRVASIDYVPPEWSPSDLDLNLDRGPADDPAPEGGRVINLGVNHHEFVAVEYPDPREGAIEVRVKVRSSSIVVTNQADAFEVAVTSFKRFGAHNEWAVYKGRIVGPNELVDRAWVGYFSLAHRY
jgi:hypothetical protein